jgi:hypothetical protein
MTDLSAVLSTVAVFAEVEGTAKAERITLTV